MKGACSVDAGGRPVVVLGPGAAAEGSVESRIGGTAARERGFGGIRGLGFGGRENSEGETWTTMGRLSSKETAGFRGKKMRAKAEAKRLVRPRGKKEMDA